MKLRAPAYPLVTVDPYFSLWSASDTLNGDTVRHWTCKPNTMYGYVTVDGEKKRFMGFREGEETIPQVSVEVTALSTVYVFEDGKIRLTAAFTSPLLMDDLVRMTRPVSYLALSYVSLDGNAHEVTAEILASEELVMNERGEGKAEYALIPANGLTCVRMGLAEQKILCRSGDDLRIEWGYFYLAVSAAGAVGAITPADDGMTYITAEAPVSEGEETLFLLAYDDLYSINYFGTTIKSLWNADGTTITEALHAAYADYPELKKACAEFSGNLYRDALAAGGEQYAEIVSLAYRQVIAAHKLCKNPDGKLVFISKECHSNGCAATVDVSYPSIPLFLLYCPELVWAMMRPVYHYAYSDQWQFDFAPHDAGQYPLLLGQVYHTGNLERQMPVEECGNMLIMEAASAIAKNDVSFASEHWDLLSGWVTYLVKFGEDPENQLCTDDFAGHLAHNCNLSIKAIMGVAAYAILSRMRGDEDAYASYMEKARTMAGSWCRRAANGDGSYRLAFDRPGSFSMKYNAVWDILFGTEIFPEAFFKEELASNFEHFDPYGMPLDNRSSYTKSDWIIWTATMLSDRADFEKYIAPMYRAYNEMKTRVPLGDWYDTKTADCIHFQNRTVQGGLFMKLLRETGKMKA